MFSAHKYIYNDRDLLHFISLMRESFFLHYIDWIESAWKPAIKCGK